MASLRKIVKDDHIVIQFDRPAVVSEDINQILRQEIAEEFKKTGKVMAFEEESKIRQGDGLVLVYKKIFLTPRDLGLRLLDELSKENISYPAVEFWVKAGADLSVRDALGTPLNYAARLGGLAMVKLVVEHGGDINARGDHHGRTPLLTVISMFENDVVEYLLSQGADPDVADDDGHGALAVANNVGNGAAAEMVRVVYRDREAKILKEQERAEQAQKHIDHGLPLKNDVDTAKKVKFKK